MTNTRILIADDDDALLHSLALRCTHMGFRVSRAHDAMTALAMIDQSPPDLVCLDVEMPPGNGLSVAEMMADDDRLNTIPVVILTGKTDPQTQWRSEDVGAHFVRKDSQMWEHLEPLLRKLSGKDQAETEAIPAADASPAALYDSTPCESEPCEPTPCDAALSDADRPAAEASSEHIVDCVFALLGAGEGLLDDDGKTAEQPRVDSKTGSDIPWVLTIDDDPDFSWILKKRLERHGVAVVRAFDGTDGYRTAFTRPANLITLDFEMPNGQGDYVLRRLKENPITKDIPVIMLTGKRNRALERKILNLGACRYMHKPYNFDELLAEIQKHIEVLPVTK